MADETRIERRLDRAVARATTPRGAAIVIASATTMITIVAGLLVTVLERDTYPSIGTGLWWAAQTVTTVGYGDNVPTSSAGRLVAVLVMFVGIGFLTVVTAAITSTFVAQARRVDRTPSDVETRWWTSSVSSTAGSKASKPLWTVPRRLSSRRGSHGVPQDRRGGTAAGDVCAAHREDAPRPSSTRRAISSTTP